MKLSEVVATLEDLVPTSLAGSWDNVGLLLGDPAQDVSRVLLAVDATDAVIAEAERQGCELIICYHPILFDGVKRVTAGSPAFRALRAGIAAWSPHSALDVVDGGTSDVLADALGLATRAPLCRAEAAARSCKLVVFTPEDALDRVSRALFDAGAGVIGEYACCSFRAPGTGTFHGSDATQPAVGAKGRLEQVAELRLEVVAPLARLAEILAALRSSHPYEEPAFDLVPLLSEPGLGLGRIGDLATPTPVVEVLARVRAALALTHLLVAGPRDVVVGRAACAPGSCGDLWRDAQAQGAALWLTGEMRHHEALAAAHAGMTVACTLHSNSERAALKPLAERLAARLPSLHLDLSLADRDPFEIA
jgi:dinuclear metal center YbgI/SA1388 family protein